MHTYATHTPYLYSVLPACPTKPQSQIHTFCLLLQEQSTYTRFSFLCIKPVTHTNTPLTPPTHAPHPPIHTAFSQVRFVVMNNVFRTDLDLHRKFDLKGSTHGRTAGPRASHTGA